MAKFEQKSNEVFDPNGSIFLPKTKNHQREFGNWEVAIMMRRGILFRNVTSQTESYDYQQALYSELELVRNWYIGHDALVATGIM